MVRLELERGGVVVSAQDGYIYVAVGVPRLGGERVALELKPAEARWLATVALPAALSALAEP
jgi:hypothetical protein